jgi:hypothetical protein
VDDCLVAQLAGLREKAQIRFATEGGFKSEGGAAVEESFHFRQEKPAGAHGGLCGSQG